MDIKYNLNGFTNHNVFINKTAGNQSIADCPFCYSLNKFYINNENRLWDCKVCGVNGNFEDFLTKINKLHIRNLSEGKLESLAYDRQLPKEAFLNWGIGYTDKYYTFPIYNAKKIITDIRRYKPGGKLLSTSGTHANLINILDIIDSNKKDSTVYLCEGEWDMIALKWLFKKLGKKAVVVAVPGANIFKTEWAPYFLNRNVVVLYDNDQAGIDGELKVLKALIGTVKSIRFLHWSDALPTKFDIRDLIVKYKKLKKLRKAYKYIHKKLQDVPRTKTDANLPTNSDLDIIEKEKLKHISSKQLILEYQKWLHLPNIDVINIMYGTIWANKLGGDPVWMFLVAPPGGSKSELLMSLSASDQIHALTSLTPHTLISGTSWKDGKDPSLLPQLDKKILIIKDFTAILTMHYSVRDEIFGTLRDIYDGSTEKAFGNGIKRSYQVHFGVLAGVTPIIEMFNAMHSSLGERFLKYRITGNWDAESEDFKILRALKNLGNEESMRSELKHSANRYISNMELPTELPIIPESYYSKLISLAKFCARLRGVVERDKYTQAVMYKPSSEVGTRIAKQLSKLGLGICLFQNKKELDNEVYRLLCRIALDTVPDRMEDIVRALWIGGEQGKKGLKTSEIADITRLPQSTIFRLLQDLNLLKTIEKDFDNPKQIMWKLSKKIAKLFKIGRIYE